MQIIKLAALLSSVLFLSACGKTISGQMHVSEDFQIESTKRGVVDVLSGEYEAKFKVKKVEDILKIKATVNGEYGESKFDFIIPSEAYNEESQTIHLPDFPSEGQNLSGENSITVDTSRTYSSFEQCWLVVNVERCFVSMYGIRCMVEQQQRSGTQYVKYYFQTTTDFINIKIERTINNFFDKTVAEFDAREVKKRKIYTHTGICNIH